MAKRGHCILKAVCDEMRGVAESTSKEFLKASANQVCNVPKPSKNEAWDDPGSQNAALKLHRAAKRQPRVPEQCPRDAQEASKRGQEPPKSEQKPAK